MKTAIKKKWLAALESGDYGQHKGELGQYNDFGNDEMCCLGVLCDVMLDDDKAPITLDPRVESDYAITFNQGQNAVLPEVLGDYVGLASNPDFSFDIVEASLVFDNTDHGYAAPFDGRGVHVDMHLAALNDAGFSFSQIADVIRWAVPDE